MTSETINALATITSLYVCAIEGSGTKIPDEVLEQVATNPFKGCEALNTLALSCNAIDVELDEKLQGIYEAMDAEDAHGEPTNEAIQACLGAYAAVHIDIPEPEPEPEPEEAESPEAEEAAEDSDNAPKRRNRRQRKNKKDASSEAGETTEVEQSEGNTASEQTEEKPTKAKRTRKREPRAEKPAEEAASAEEAAPAEQTTSTEDAPSEKKLAKKASKKKDVAFEGEAFSVDQALAILGMKRPQLTKLIESGELPAYKKGRAWQISATAVLDLAAKQA